jgi:3'-5' exoribonuclease
MSPQKNLSDLKPGDEILHYLAVNKFELKTAKNGKSFVNLELRDKTGTISAKLWDSFESLLPGLKEGVIIRIKGTVEEYLNQLQIKVDKIKIAPPEDGVTIHDFLPRSRRDLDVMKSELNDRIALIENTYLKQLIEKVFSGDAFEKYSNAPAGKGWHHAYIHGLLEHTLEIIKICDLMCSIHSQLNKDLLITGAMLHDFGKIFELTFDNVFDYSDEGKLLGHIVIAAAEVEKQIETIDGFPKDLRIQLIHLILSHQGKLEFASPIEPKTLEAIVLYHADELSAKTNAYKNAILAEKGKGSHWTKFIPLANNSLYIPDEIINNES